MRVSRRGGGGGESFDAGKHPHPQQKILGLFFNLRATKAKREIPGKPASQPANQGAPYPQNPKWWNSMAPRYSPFPRPWLMMNFPKWGSLFGQ